MTPPRLISAGRRYVPTSKPLGWRGLVATEFALATDLITFEGNTLLAGSLLRHEQTDWDTQATLIFIVFQVFRVMTGDHAGKLVEFHIVGDDAAYDWLPAEVRPMPWSRP